MLDSITGWKMQKSGLSYSSFLFLSQKKWYSQMSNCLAVFKSSNLKTLCRIGFEHVLDEHIGKKWFNKNYWIFSRNILIAMIYNVSLLCYEVLGKINKMLFFHKWYCCLTRVGQSFLYFTIKVDSKSEKIIVAFL